MELKIIIGLIILGIFLYYLKPLLTYITRNSLTKLFLRQLIDFRNRVNLLYENRFELSSEEIANEQQELSKDFDNLKDKIILRLGKDNKLTKPYEDYMKRIFADLTHFTANEVVNLTDKDVYVNGVLLPKSVIYKNRLKTNIEVKDIDKTVIKHRDGDIPIARNPELEFTDIPNPKQGVLFLVPYHIAINSNRTDLVVGDETLRDEKGKIIGYKRLIVPNLKGNVLIEK